MDIDQRIRVKYTMEEDDECICYQFTVNSPRFERVSSNVKCIYEVSVESREWKDAHTKEHVPLIRTPDSIFTLLSDLETIFLSSKRQEMRGNACKNLKNCNVH